MYAAQRTANATTPTNMAMKNSVNMQNYNSIYILISWVANAISYSTSLSFPNLGYTNNYLTKTCPGFGQVYFRWTSPTQMTYHANSTPSGLTNLNIQVYVAKDK